MAVVLEKETFFSPPLIFLFLFISYFLPFYNKNSKFAPSVTAHYPIYPHPISAKI
jgi:hypothetical protein